MFIVSRAIGRVERLVSRRINLFRLSRQTDAVSKAIAGSIRDTLSGSFTPEDSKIVARIETLRGEMERSTAPITRVDYGAGLGDSRRTPEEMARGVEVTSALGDITRAASKPALWAGLLFRLIRELRPNSCVEMGTAVGISAAYQTAALELNERGKLVSLDGAPAVAEIARKNLQALGLKRVEVVVGNFRDTLPEVLRREQPIDYVFVDGHHDERATLDYFELLLPSLAKTSVLVFDDISWSDGMKRAWGSISRDPRVSLAVDLGAVGLCVVGPSPHRLAFKIPLT
jgi:predicted O-methyltransferase YrrM